MRTFMVLLLALLFISGTGCSKKGSSPNPVNTDSVYALYIGGSLSRIITVEQDASNYKYLWLQGGSGYVYRSDIAKTYSFSQLVQDRDCKWKVQSSTLAVNGGSGNGTFSSMNNEEVIIRSDKYPNQYWGVMKGSTLNGYEEWRLTTFYFSTKPSPVPDYLKFKLHQVADQNGVHAFTIESVLKPGFYLNNSGHNILANGVSMVDHTMVSTPKTVFEFH
jgi:hypothetical protein